MADSILGNTRTTQTLVVGTSASSAIDFFGDTSLALDTDGNAGQVYRLYQAAFDRTPDAAGLAHNLNLLNTTLTRADMLAAYSESAENQLNVIGQIQDGVWFT